jgi:CRP-like cAMP-binding protein
MSGNGAMNDEPERRLKSMSEASLSADEGGLTPSALGGGPATPWWVWLAVGGVTVLGGLVLFLTAPLIATMSSRFFATEERTVDKPGAADFEHLRFNKDEDRTKRDLPAALDGVDARDLMAARMHIHAVEIGLGDVLIAEGAEDPALAWVVTGELEVRVGGVDVGHAYPEEVVGEMSLFEEAKRAAEVRAAMPTRVIIVQRNGYEAMASAGSPVALILEQVALQCMGRRLRDTARNLAKQSVGIRTDLRDASKPTIRRRLAAFADSLSPLDAGPEEDPGVVLTGTAVFAHLEREHLQALANQMHMVDYQAGQTVFAQGDTGDAMYVLIRGRCDLLLATEQANDMQVIDDLFPGDVFGMTSLFAVRDRAGSCMALSDVTLLGLKRDTVRELIGAESDLGRVFRIALIRALSASIREANAHLAGRDTGDRQSDNLMKARAVMLSRPGAKPLGS